jgi:hypothetical protein
VVGVLDEGGEHLGLAREQALLVGRESVPVLDLGGFGASLVPGGTTPIAICRASVSSRILSQPWSNLPFHLAIHSLGTWCGACTAPGAK